MNKTELLDDLASKPDVLEIINRDPDAVKEPADLGGPVHLYDIPFVLDKGNGVVNGASQPILVINQGTADEVAYYNIKKNFAHEQIREKSQLQQDAEAYLDTQLKKTWGAGKLLKYDINQVNEDKGHVKATGYTDAGTVEQGLVFFDDSTSAWTHQILN